MGGRWWSFSKFDIPQKPLTSYLYSLDECSKLYSDAFSYTFKVL